MTALTCSIALAEGPIVQSVEIEGTRRPLSLTTRAGEAVDEKLIEKDVRRLWATGWFHDIRVESSDAADGVKVVFRVVEKPRYYVRKVRIEPRNERRDVRVEPGTLMDRSRAQQVAASVQRRLAEEGHRDAKVQPVLTGAGVQQVDLLLKIERGDKSKPPAPPAASGKDKELCRCLLEARRAAEGAGRIDFSAHLDPEDRRPVIEPGPQYTVGRIEFRGNHSVGDITLRRALKVDEGDLLDQGRLRESLARINRLGVFEPLGDGDVDIIRDPSALRADVAIRLLERPRGRWSVSGPVGPLSFAGPLQATIATRLPGWGQGLLEASTYFVSFSVSGFSDPVARILALGPPRRFLPLIALERPVLPGQRWQSGFAVSPQLGLRETLAGYGLAQLHLGARSALNLDSPPEPALIVPGALVCEPPRSRWRWLRWLL